MYLVIVGGGKVGAPLASALINEGHEVFVLDHDPDRVAALQRELGMVATVGDASSLRALEDAGASRAGAIIATTDSDEDNLAACQLARNNFDVPRTIAVANSPENARLFELVGVDLVVSATDLVISNLATALPAHPLIRLMPVADRTQELVAIKLPAAGVVIGRALSEITLPYGTNIILIVTADGRTKTPDADAVIEAEDEIVALSPANTTAELWEVLTELR
ncbi:MAG: TrkA family potassium uptake protein [Chloroflexi bacterium]|nr:TrkA family potassium uptake protein [Chloroflexota bacterium]MCI0774215.1 TrkA family potassium uptake protein [Chloroflexota bacterium]MCI0804226.1 TrkA family potassium uptake protein [Chloroflexota bacterium]MCI0807807.1 TrkA family potassium uptake protein [Chloroflexota bacterium]MCI0833451.1 TrkA family potassium uptake protein [Chloroflexota bacterium]